MAIIYERSEGEKTIKIKRRNWLTFVILLFSLSSSFLYGIFGIIVAIILVAVMIQEHLKYQPELDSAIKKGRLISGKTGTGLEWEWKIKK